MSSRLVLDELDVNFPPLATGLVIIIVVVIGGSTDARTLDASSISIAIASERVLSTRALVGVGILDVGHGPRCRDATKECCRLRLAGDGRIGYDVDCEGVDYCVGLEMMGSRQMLLIEVGDGGEWEKGESGRPSTKRGSTHFAIPTFAATPTQMKLVGKCWGMTTPERVNLYQS